MTRREHRSRRMRGKMLIVIIMLVIGLTLVFWWPGSMASFVGGILLLLSLILWLTGWIVY